MDCSGDDDESSRSSQSAVCRLVPLVQHSVGLVRRPPPTASPLVVEFGVNESLRVLDPEAGACVVSTVVARCTAAAGRYSHMGSGEQIYTDPVLIVNVPGLAALRIRPAPINASQYGNGDYRYTWLGTVRDVDQPAYVVTEAEWLLLIEKLGLSSRIVDDVASGGMTRRRRRRTIEIVVSAVFIVTVVALSIYLHYAR